MAAHLGMALGGVFQLLFTTDVMEQTSGDQHIPIHPFSLGDLQGVIQHPVDMLGIVGAVGHGGKHVALQQIVGFLLHGIHLPFS